MDMPRLFVLRVWSAPSDFRAVVRDVALDRIAHFTDPSALCCFLFGGEVPADRSTNHCPLTGMPETSGSAGRTPPGDSRGFG
jgi:hypothetical protein